MIKEMGETSAFVCPVNNLDSDPIKVPIEHLSKCPEEISDIAFLPKQSRRKFQNEPITFIPTQNLTINCLNFITELGGTSSMIAGGNAMTKIQWNAQCQKTEKKHADCAPILIGQIIPSLVSTDPLGRQELDKLSMVVILKHTSSKILLGKIREWGKIQDPEKRTESLCKLASEIPVDPKVIQEAIALWINSCSVAFSLLKNSGFSEIIITDQDKGLSTELNGEMTKAIAKSFENIRSNDIHSIPNLIQEPYVLIGGCDAIALNSTFSAFLISQKNTMEMAKTITSYGFGSEVQELIIAIGSEDIREGIPLDKVHSAIRAIAGHLTKFPLRIFWIPLPYNHTRKEEYEAYFVMLNDSLAPHKGPIRLVLIKNFRSFMEIFRFGDGFNNHIVDSDGKIKKSGIIAISHFARAVFQVQCPLKQKPEKGEKEEKADEEKQGRKHKLDGQSPGISRSVPRENTESQGHPPPLLAGNFPRPIRPTFSHSADFQFRPSFPPPNIPSTSQASGPQLGPRFPLLKVLALISILIRDHDFELYNFHCIDLFF
jgi:hypothetical protein